MVLNYLDCVLIDVHKRPWQVNLFLGTMSTYMNWSFLQDIIAFVQISEMRSHYYSCDLQDSDFFPYLDCIFATFQLPYSLAFPRCLLLQLNFILNHRSFLFPFNCLCLGISCYEIFQGIDSRMKTVYPMVWSEIPRKLLITTMVKDTQRRLENTTTEILWV